MTDALQKFIEVKTRESNNRRNAWFNHCVLNKTPYIILTTKTKFADILWDHTSYPLSYEYIFNSNEDFIKIEAENICEKYKYNIERHINSGQISIKGLLLNDARQVASDIYDLISRLTSAS